MLQYSNSNRKNYKKYEIATGFLNLADWHFTVDLSLIQIHIG